MKVLLINSRFFVYGGPDKYCFNIKNILETNGHEVIPFSTQNHQNEDSLYSKYFIDSIGGNDKVFYEEYKLSPKTLYQIIERQFYSFAVRRKLETLIIDTKPDVAYILHHANKLSPSVIDACKHNNLPVVLRISDFSLLCVDHYLMRKGEICEKCTHQSPFQAVKYKCVKNSKIASLIKVLALQLHRKLNIYKRVDKIIVPSTFTISKLSSILNKNKLSHIPTPVISKNNVNIHVGKYMLCVGRLEEEKGFIYAIKAVANTDIPLLIAGNSHTGYGEILFQYVKSHNIKNVTFLGRKSSEELPEIYADARAVIIPGIWYENLPNVSLEAMSYSKPIIAFNLGSMKEIVTDGYNGLLVPPKDVTLLQKAIMTLMNNPSKAQSFGENAYKEATTTYAPDTHYKKLLNEIKSIL